MISFIQFTFISNNLLQELRFKQIKKTIRNINNNTLQFTISRCITNEKKIRL